MAAENFGSLMTKFYHATQAARIEFDKNCEPFMEEFHEKCVQAEEEYMRKCAPFAAEFALVREPAWTAFVSEYTEILRRR